MAQTSLGPRKFVQEMGSSIQWDLIMAPDQEANADTVWKFFELQQTNGILCILRGHPRGQFGRKSLPKLADFSLSSAEGEVKMYRMYREIPKFGPKLLPEILNMLLNFSLSESSRMTLGILTKIASMSKF